MPNQSVASSILTALVACDPYAKVMAARRAYRDWRLGRLDFTFEQPMPDEPGRPDAPELVRPSQMPKRGRGRSLRGRIALFHALAHIEFVAIDLALDMAGRFGAEMGPEFVADFLSVAADEAMHFALLDRHLRAMGSHYGAHPAHGGLWEAAVETRLDVAARLAIVPMVLEARGLDVTPSTIRNVRAAGDARGALILERILDDEIRHVRFGASYFEKVCIQRQMDSGAFFKSLVNCHFRGSLKPPFNDSARRSAGLSREFYAGIAS